MRMKQALSMASVALIIGAASPSLAQASVTGARGVEIEGPRDRRGFYIGPGLQLGGAFPGDQVIAATSRVSLLLGGGVTKAFTLGVDLHLDPLFTDKAGLGFGGDLEGTGFVWKGFYLRLGLGAAGVPVASGDRSISVGVGGRAGLGYEFFLNQTVAMSVGADYDLRMVSGGGAVSAALVGVRIIWY